MLVFPIAQLPPSAWRWDIAGVPLTGGTPVAGAPQTADAATGGWWTVELSIAMISSRIDHKTWRTIAGYLRRGGRIAVPMIEAVQPWLDGVIGLGAGRFFELGLDDDDAIFVSDLIHAELAADAYMPAYPSPAVAPSQAQIRMVSGAPIETGMVFSIRGATSAISHPHLIDTVLDVTGNVYTVLFGPPLREDYPSGTRLEMDSPMCGMKVDPASIGSLMPSFGPGFVSSPGIKLIETFS